MQKWLQLTAAAVLFLIQAGIAYAAGENVSGQWSAPVTLPLVPSSGSLLPNGKLLLWAADGEFYFGRGGSSSHTVLVDPVTLSQQPMTVDVGHNMFCTGTTNLADGRILVNGGSQSEATSIYDPVLNTFTRVQNMRVFRGYNANTILGDGSVFTFGGSWSGLGAAVNKIGEVWTEAQGWRSLPNVTTTSSLAVLPASWSSDSHFWLLPAGNGKVLYAGPHPVLKWINTNGNGTMTSIGPRGDDAVALNGNTVMYDTGKILKTGGAPIYTNAPASAASYLIDTAHGVQVTKLGPMAYPRGYHNSVVMPDGKVLVVGGQTYVVSFSDYAAVLATEIWDPVTRKFSIAAPISVPRNYHSIALLLPDGRILSGGGGLCACAADHPNFQIFSPPYLFDANGNPADRPVINSAPTELPYGGTVQVTTNRDVQSFALVRVNSTTHSVNHDQRRIVLSHTRTDMGQYTLSVPSNSGYLLPGYWMLFAIDANGVPSVSKFVHVQSNTIARMVSPEPIIADTANAIGVQPEITGLTANVIYGGTGLPPGVSVDPATGYVSGTPSASGSFFGALTATDGIRTVSVDLDITVANPPNRPPMVAKPADQVNTVGVAANLAISASDPDNDNLTFSASGLPLGLGIDSATGLISGTTTAAGVYSPSVTASDGHLADTQTFAWSINAEPPPNRPPSVVTPSNQISSVGGTANLTVSAFDPDNDALTFSASDLPSGLEIGVTTGVITGTITAPGNHLTSVTASDGSLTDTKDFAWNVADIVPQVTSLAIAPQVVGATVDYAPVIANTTSVTYSWNFGDGTAATAFAATAEMSHVFTSPGIYAVSLAMKNASGSQYFYSFDQAINTQPLVGEAATSSSAMAYETRLGASSRLWVANRDNDSVSVIDLVSNSRVAEISVGSDPVTVARHPNGTIWVVNRGSGTLSFISAVTLAVTKTVNLGRGTRPFGLVFAGAANDGFVALEATDKLIRVKANGKLQNRVDAGRAPRFVATDGARSRVYVASFITPPLPGESTAKVATVNTAGQPLGGEVWDFTTDSLFQRKMVLQHSDRPDTESSARGIPNYLAAPAVSPDGSSMWVPSKQDNIKRGMRRDGRDLNFQNSVRAIVSRIDLGTGLEDLASRIDVDNSGIVSAIAFHPSGAYLFAALQTSREVAVLDPNLKREIFRFGVGRAPSSLAVSPDGLKLYVGNFMDRSVSVIDLAALVTAGQKSVTVEATVPTIAVERLAPDVLTGKQLFYDAADVRLARDGYISCAVCHDSGGGDGRVWDFTGFGEGLRNTITLEGHGGMQQGFLHWTANFDEIQDFEGQIRGFAGGTGLMSDSDFFASNRFAPLGATKAGFSADLDALAAYLTSLNTVPLSPYRNADGSLTAKAQAGKSVFNAQGCAVCHAGAAMTISGNASMLRNVGTANAASGQRLGQPLTGFDVPSLRGLWATAPYLHNGSKSLSAAVRAHQNATISNTDMTNLTRYLTEIEQAP